MSYDAGKREIVCLWLVVLIPIQKIPIFWSRKLWKLCCENYFNFSWIL